jgi:hypothetical protein
MCDQHKKMHAYSEFPHASHAHMHTLMDCYTICAACAKMCTEEGHKKTALLCSDCADICALAIKLHSRDSEFNRQILALCAEVCTRCARECATMKAKHCQQCSEICHACAKACKEAE